LEIDMPSDESTKVLPPPCEVPQSDPTLLFGVAVGAIVLPLYAAQPITALVGASFGIPIAAYGLIGMMSMLGYASGLFLLVPLTDLFELRRIVLTMVCAETLSLAAVALAPAGAFFFLASFAIGASASVIQMLIPAAAALAPAAQRGRIIGKVMSGLMTGILASRPIASLAAKAFGWRGSYGLDAVVMLAVLAVLYHVLPWRRPAVRLGYRALLGSLWALLIAEPVLRRRAMYQALCMGSFGLFWTAVALRLSDPPFKFAQAGIALFSLAGIGGAVIAPVAGWLGDRGWGGIATLAAHAAVVTGSILAGIAGAGWLGFDGLARPTLSLVMLLLSAVVLDIGVIGDQTLGRRTINLLGRSEQGRLNGVYTGVFFLGGSAGSAIAGTAWATMGWSLVCAIGAGFGALALCLAVFDAMPFFPPRVSS
jgi:predicted MFS family arabinose efflux permease